METTLNNYQVDDEISEEASRKIEEKVLEFEKDLREGKVKWYSMEDGMKNRQEIVNKYVPSYTN